MGTKSPPLLEKDDGRIRYVPFMTDDPTFEEVSSSSSSSSSSGSSSSSCNIRGSSGSSNRNSSNIRGSRRRLSSMSVKGSSSS